MKPRRLAQLHCYEIKENVPVVGVDGIQMVLRKYTHIALTSIDVFQFSTPIFPTPCRIAPSPSALYDVQDKIASFCINGDNKLSAFVCNINCLLVNIIVTATADQYSLPVGCGGFNDII